MTKHQEIKLMSVAGARPNFMKLASIAHAVHAHNASESGQTPSIRHIIVHTGQHYDEKMSHQFFDELAIPKPDIDLGVGSGSHASQTAEIMKRFESILLQVKPDALLVVGDVNSTIACTLVAAKIDYGTGCRRRPIIIHVEAGLRSFDRDMPEEVNRILTDCISDMLFVTEESGITNLKKEGVDPGKVHFAGNVMIDTLCEHLTKAKSSAVKDRLSLTGPYGVVTLHRPSNVDTPETLRPLLECLAGISQRLRLIFPVHPRTKGKIQEFGLAALLAAAPGLQLTEPLGYLDFLQLTSNATLMLTDSGGIQEETTYLHVPCITLRENTERPVTVAVGSNYLIGVDPSRLIETVEKILSGNGKQSHIPALWDGKAGERIVSTIVRTILSVS